MRVWVRAFRTPAGETRAPPADRLFQIDEALFVDALGLGSHALVVRECHGRHQQAQSLRLRRRQWGPVGREDSLQRVGLAPHIQGRGQRGLQGIQRRPC
jgi:hypothetical protein